MQLNFTFNFRFAIGVRLTLSYFCREVAVLQLFGRFTSHPAVFIDILYV
jgi:hypothetical protein